MKNRISKSKAAKRAVEKNQTGDVIWRKFADGTQTVEVVGEKRALLRRATSDEGTTPEKLINRLLSDGLAAREGGEKVQGHELMLSRPDGTAIDWIEISAGEVRELLAIAKRRKMTASAALGGALQLWLETDGGVKKAVSA